MEYFEAKKGDRLNLRGNSCSRIPRHSSLVQSRLSRRMELETTSPSAYNRSSDSTAVPIPKGEDPEPELESSKTESDIALVTTPRITNYDLDSNKGEIHVKVICLGDSAVGKSKLLDRFLQDTYKPQQLSTYALNIFTHKTTVNCKPVIVDLWDTAGQERFSSLHPSYYHQAHACVMVFDATRKVTYKNLPVWYKELREYRPEIPCLLAVNKIDANYEVTTKTFAFPEQNNIPFYCVSASDGTNVVKVFRDAISAAVEYKLNPSDWKDQIFAELEGMKRLSETTGGETSSKQSS